MENTIYAGLSRQMVLGKQMSVIANNMANVNTPAFKLNSLLQVENVRRPDNPTLAGMAPLSMAASQAVVRDTSQGSLTQTSNPLDIALQGDGYLSVASPAGPRYTRNGHLALSLDRQLVDVNGLPVLDAGGAPITIPEDAGQLAIAKDGTISGANGQIGRIGIVSFTDQFAMVPMGGGLHSTNELPQEATDTAVIQGSLEKSNVQAILEMTRMIEVSRSYQSIANFLKDEQERQRTAIDKLSGNRG